MAFLPVADGSRHEAGHFFRRQIGADTMRRASANGRLFPTTGERFLRTADGLFSDAGMICEPQMAADANRDASANGRQAPTQWRKQNQIAECPGITGFSSFFTSETPVQCGLAFPKFKTLEMVSEKQNCWCVYKLCFGHDG
jgi:hypothetical protein